MVVLCVLHYNGGELESLVKLMVDLVLWNEIWENHTIFKHMSDERLIPNVRFYGFF